MKRLSVIVVFLGLVVLPCLAQAIDRPEIESVAGKTIEFINYVGPHSRIDSLESIKDIGRGLGSLVSTRAVRGGSLAKYYIIHAVDPATPSGFDADIIVIGPDAEVDHIDNLRWIIAGYLMSAYGYNERDARALAVFITVYNAVYRSDMAYFGAKYKKAVVGELSSANAGLPIRWDQWAGNSRIVIPLSSGLKGDISAVDTSSISDEKTIESIQKNEEDKGVEPRRDIVDIKEAEIAKDKESIAEEKADIAAEEKAIEEAKAGIAEEKAALEEEKASGSAETGTIEKKEAEIAAKEAEVAKAEEAVAADKAAVAAAEEKVAAKEAEVAKERESIAKDTKEVIAGEVAAKTANKIVLIQAIDPSYPYARLVAVDVDSGEIVIKSDVNTIRARTLVEDSGQFVVISGRPEGTGAVRLIALDKNTLKLTDQGTDDIYPESWLWKNDAGLFAVVVKGGKYYLGKFDSKLDLVVASEIEVDPLTFLLKNDLGIIVQKASGGFVILNPKDLSLIREIGK